MIVLIGGASHTGKTRLAQRLLEKMHLQDSMLRLHMTEQN